VGSKRGGLYYRAVQQEPSSCRSPPPRQVSLITSACQQCGCVPSPSPNKDLDHDLDLDCGLPVCVAEICVCACVWMCVC
jgi:hypothetical protein